MNKKELLLFDFDGVMVNTLGICFDIDKKAKLVSTLEDYKKNHEGNIYQTIAGESIREKDKLKKNFFGSYEPKLMNLPLIGTFADALEQFKNNFTMVIISSSLDTSIERFLTEHNSLRYFEEILGVNKGYDKNEKIERILNKFKKKPTETIFITDTLGDIREASSVGVASIAVTWGFHEHNRLAQGNPFAIVNTPFELVKEVKKFFNSPM